MQEPFSYLDALNPSQREAVVHTGGPLLVLSGAGSGKTRVITCKIAYLIQSNASNPYGIRAHNILAVTFTKKAANEMSERAIDLVPEAARCSIRTFHSFGSWFLRCYSEAASVDPNFTVYDEDDSTTLVQKAVPTLTKIEARHYQNLISLAKDYCLEPDSELLSTVSNDEVFPTIYEAYQDRLRKTGNVDFGDLIMLPIKVLETQTDIQDRVHERFRVVMVDEYQDTNVAQYTLLRALYSKDIGTYICVVGDDDQSIYKFRGAKVENILNFGNEFPNTTVVRLEDNYRSTEEILHQADCAISHNEHRLGKVLRAVRGKGEPPTLVFLPNQDNEAKLCLDLINNARAKGVPYSDWAILYRTNAQSLAFETLFARMKVPYKIIGALRFFEREEVKDVVAYLSLVANPHDEVSFRRVVNKPSRGIGEATQDKVVEYCLQEGISILDACDTIASHKKIGAKALKGLKEFSHILHTLVAKLTGEDYNAPHGDETLVGLLVQEVNGSVDDEGAKERRVQQLSTLVERVSRDSGLEDYYSEQDDIAKTQKVNNIQALANDAAIYPLTMSGLLEFLDHINLERTLSDEDSGRLDSVVLITLHNTKGLEFPRVVITGMEDGIFPRKNKSPEEIEEERRLLYVGITRARDRLYFTSCAVRRMYYGQTSYMMPSPFLSELDTKALKIVGDVPMSFTRAMQGEWSVGTKVHHDDYGTGYIVANEKANGEVVITVRFETGSKMNFLPQYQKNKLMIIKD